MRYWMKELDETFLTEKEIEEFYKQKERMEQDWVLDILGE